MIDDDPTDPLMMAHLLHHLATDFEMGRFPSWVVGRCNRAVSRELDTWMSVRRDADRTTRSNVVALRRVAP